MQVSVSIEKSFRSLAGIKKMSLQNSPHQICRNGLSKILFLVIVAITIISLIPSQSLANDFQYDDDVNSVWLEEEDCLEDELFLEEKPNSTDWIQGRLPKDKLNLISWIVDGCFYFNRDSTPAGFLACDFTIAHENDEEPPEFQSFDGFFNNVFKTDLGAVDSPLLRRVPPVYADGTYEPVKGKRINPFEASKLMTRSAVCGEGTETVACGSKTGKSAFLVYFGQQVVEEVLDAQRAGCPPEYFNVPIPEDHEFRTLHPQKSFMPFLRSRYLQSSGSGPGNPRQQLNEITPWMDGGLIYGTAKGWSDVLRTFPNGTLHPHGQLASDNDEGYFPARNTLRLPLANPPPPAFHSEWISKHETAKVNRFFVLGNPRGNENAFLLTFGVVLFRWHNQFAMYLHESRPGWSGERVFQEARKWSMATYESIVYYDWLVQWLGESLDRYKGYDPSVDPQIEQFFQTAAMRFGHTLVTPGAYLRDYTCAGCKRIAFYGLGGDKDPVARPGEAAVRTCNIFWRPQEPLVMEHLAPQCLVDDETINDDRNFADIDRMLMGMASQRSEREDNMIVEDLRGRVFGPLEFSRRDLMVVNIQRGRDHGTPDYNTARAALGLNRIYSVDQYINETQTATPKDILETMESIHRYGDEPREAAWDNIDVWTGGILETSDRPGPLFRAIIKDQFTRIRNADRFWFENKKWDKERFSDEQIGRIRSLKVFDLVVSVTRMTQDDIQPNPFRVPNDRDNALSCVDEEQWRENPCYQPTYNSNGKICTNTSSTCFSFPQLDSEENPVEMCTTPATYDYFSGSELSFILTYVLLGLLVLTIFISLRIYAFRAQKQKVIDSTKNNAKTKKTFQLGKFESVPIAAREWQNAKENTRAIGLIVHNKRIEVRTHRGELLREIELSKREFIQVKVTKDKKYAIVKNHIEYDLVLEFDGEIFQDEFLRKLATEIGVDKKEVKNFKEAIQGVVTKEERLVQLQRFFRVVFKLSALPSVGSNGTTTLVSAQSVKSQSELEGVQQMELSMSEFANALGMDPKSEIIKKMFELADVNHNGVVSFLEFFTMLSTFKKGTPEEKVEYIFRMYDTDADGFLSQEEFVAMLKSIIKLQLEDEDPDVIFKRIMTTTDLERKPRVGLRDFQGIFAENKESLGYNEMKASGPPSASVGKKGNRMSYMQSTRDSIFQLLEEPVGRNNSSHRDQNDPIEEEVNVEVTPPSETQQKHWVLIWFEVHRLQVFWLTIYNCLVIAIFAERSYYYSIESEHRGFRHIAGMGVSFTRGAASVQMFCYATLLLTMCRNIVTDLRESFLRHYIPMESFVSFHKYVATVALLFTLIHVIGHGVNFYNVSTQTADDVACIFRDFFRPTHVLPKFHYWAFQTVTGLSGVLLTIHAAIIFIFASTFARTHAYKVFWITHQSYPLFYALILLHGSGQFVQPPIFINFLIGPLVIFIYDKLVTISRRFTEIAVIEVDLLPSNVTKLKFVRPTGFEYKSGQWIRIACGALNPSEFHPFTITTAPHEPYLTVHVRAVGPFTWNLRQVYESSMPKLFLDGPYGEAHQDWHRYEVSVLIGGGIGVTPFASILKDVNANANPRQCKKIYFLWVTRSQKQFEWLVDIIKEVEHHKMISVVVFITQANAHFDLRTLLLYVFERNFQKINNKSLLTGLKSVTHFGRPNFKSFFSSLKKKHSNVSQFGVFTCGPGLMAKSVDDACNEINRDVSSKIVQEFQSYSETF